mmetsp:Transcript_8674/g.27312  ORF Transcript_8674/g.27312 Transcript_8674/m.27312 type:complete len:549 (-) Transcript_8674:37-1683(-)
MEYRIVGTAVALVGGIAALVVLHRSSFFKAEDAAATAGACAPISSSLAREVNLPSASASVTVVPGQWVHIDDGMNASAPLPIHFTTVADGTSLRGQDTEQAGPTLTSWTCIDDCCKVPLHRNRSCAIHNACVVNHRLVAYVSDSSEPLPEWFGCDRNTQPGAHPALSLDRCIVGTSCEAQRPTTTLPGVTLSVEGTHFNIAHTMFDFIYPVFLSLLKLGYSPSDVRRALSRKKPADNTVHFLAAIAHEVMELQTVENVCFETLVAGGGDQGLRGWNEEYAFRGRPFDGARQYREAVYKGYGVELPEPRKGRQDHPHVLILEQAKRHLQDTAGVAASIQKLWPGATVTTTRWEKVGAMAAQLQLLRTVDIHISGSGTTHLNQFLLGDGAVVINYGHAQPCLPLDSGSECGLMFYDDYLTPGIPYIKAFYNRRATIPGRSSSTVPIKEERLKELLGCARETLASPRVDFSVEENRSPVGDAFAEMIRAFPHTMAVFRGASEPVCSLVVPEPLLHDGSPFQPGSPCRAALTEPAIEKAKAAFRASSIKDGC